MFIPINSERERGKPGQRCKKFDLNFLHVRVTYLYALAKKRSRSSGDGFVSSVKKLQRREICSKRDRAFSMSDAQERFRNIRLQGLSTSGNILTGECLAKIRARNSSPTAECSCSGCFSGRNCSSKKQIRASTASGIRSTVAEVLEVITALFYDEERNEIFTGNRPGPCMV